MCFPFIKLCISNFCVSCSTFHPGYKEPGYRGRLRHRSSNKISNRKKSISAMRKSNPNNRMVYQYFQRKKNLTQKRMWEKCEECRNQNAVAVLTLQKIIKPEGCEGKVLTHKCVTMTITRVCQNPRLAHMPTLYEKNLYQNICLATTVRSTSNGDHSCL